MSKIVFTGATGELGQLVVGHHLEKISASEVAVIVRNLEKSVGFRVCLTRN